MSRILGRLRRFYSSSSSVSAASVASDFLSRSQSIPPYKQTQLLDFNQLQRLSATLSRTELSQVRTHIGTVLPPCYHLAYFTPSQIEDELGRDGTDTTFNAPYPFTRRMWAGGELEWLGGQNNQLKIGQKVTETTKLISAMGKKTKAGEEMIVVGVEKLYENEHGVALSDKRNWIFRSEITTTQTPAPKPAQVQFPKAPEADYMRDLIQTPVSLFRFSALTFNAHKIHYNKEWCQEVEGHRDIVVHGPLNLINMVNLWRDVQRGKAIPKRVIYRATSPLYAGEKYRVLLEKEKDKISGVKIVDNYGQVSMVGQIESF